LPSSDCPIGRRFGVFKPDGNALLADVLPILATPGGHLVELSRAMTSPGRGETIRNALVEADKEAEARRRARQVPSCDGQGSGKPGSGFYKTSKIISQTRGGE
jgi:hypothetical protein